MRQKIERLIEANQDSSEMQNLLDRWSEDLIQSSVSGTSVLCVWDEIVPHTIALPATLPRAGPAEREISHYTELWSSSK